MWGGQESVGVGKQESVGVGKQEYMIWVLQESVCVGRVGVCGCGEGRSLWV